MGTTAQKLQNIINSKDNIKTNINYALTNKIDNTTTFINYGSKVKEGIINTLNNPEEIFDNLPKTTSSGTNISINDTIEAPMRIELSPSELTQDATPTPSSPQAVHTISGDNTIKVMGKNLFDVNDVVNGYIAINSTTDTITSSNDYRTSNRIYISGGQTVTLSKITGTSVYLFEFDGNGNKLAYSQIATYNSVTITLNNNTKYVRLRCDTPTPVNYNIMLEKGSTATTYEPYKGTDYSVDLSSYNLFDIESMQFQEANSAVVKINKDSKEITITNTTNQYGCIRIYQSGLDLKPSTSYVFSAKVKKSDTSTGCNAYASAGITGSSSITGSTVSVGNTCYVSFTTGATVDNNGYVALYPNGTNKYAVFSEIQIVEGSTLKSYKEYVKTPIDFCKIGNYEDKFIRTSGKNKLNLKDGTYTATDITANVSNGMITLSGTAGGNRFVSIPLNTNLGISLNETITLSMNNPVANNNVKFRIDTDGYLDTTLSSINTTNTINVSYALMNTSITIRVQSGTTLSNYVIMPMIEEGISSSDFEPYGNKTWYIKKNIGKVVLDGTQNVSTTSYSDLFYITSGNLNITYVDGGKCNYFGFVSNDSITGNSGANTNLSNNQMAFRLGSTKDRLYIKSNEYADNTALQTWFTNNNTTIYYVLDTPSYTQITGTLAEQLESIYWSKSKEGTTNISQVNNDLGFGMSVTVVEG